MGTQIDIEPLSKKRIRADEENNSFREANTKKHKEFFAMIYNPQTSTLKLKPDHITTIEFLKALVAIDIQTIDYTAKIAMSRSTGHTENSTKNTVRFTPSRKAKSKRSQINYKSNHQNLNNVVTPRVYTEVSIVDNEYSIQIMNDLALAA